MRQRDGERRERDRERQPADQAVAPPVGVADEQQQHGAGQRQRPGKRQQQYSPTLMRDCQVIATGSSRGSPRRRRTASRRRRAPIRSAAAAARAALPSTIDAAPLTAPSITLHVEAAPQAFAATRPGSAARSPRRTSRPRSTCSAAAGAGRRNSRATLSAISRRLSQTKYAKPMPATAIDARHAHQRQFERHRARLRPPLLASAAASLAGSFTSRTRRGERRAPARRRARCVRRARAGCRSSRPPPIRSPARSARAPSPAARRAGANQIHVRATAPCPCDGLRVSVRIV